MSKMLKYLTLVVLILFVLACNAVTQPFNQAQGLAKTAQALGSAMPVETLQSLATQVATQIPAGTIEALPSLAPSLEAFASQLPNFGDMFNPQGTPVSEWREIPIMPQATAGQEFADTNMYSFKADASITEVQDYYKAELEKLGWSSFFNMPADAAGSIQVFQKDNQALTITITDVDGSVVVILTLA